MKTPMVKTPVVKVRERRLKGYTAHMGFALFAIWIAVVFALASTVTNN
jgi:hypothetical protein